MKALVTDRKQLDVMWNLANSITASLQASPAIERVEVAGSLRRQKETVRDIDILVASARSQEVMDLVCSLPSVVKVLVKGDTKTSVLIKQGVQVCKISSTSLTPVVTVKNSYIPASTSSKR